MGSSSSMMALFTIPDGIETLRSMSRKAPPHFSLFNHNIIYIWYQHRLCMILSTMVIKVAINRLDINIQIPEESQTATFSTHHRRYAVYQTSDSHSLSFQALLGTILHGFCFPDTPTLQHHSLYTTIKALKYTKTLDQQQQKSYSHVAAKTVTCKVEEERKKKSNPVNSPPIFKSRLQLS